MSPGCRPIQYIVDQMPDRIAPMAVQHQLGLRRGARGEIQQQRIGGARLAVRREAPRRRAADRRSGASRPARRRPRCASRCGSSPSNFGASAAVGDQMAHPAALEPVPQVVRRQQRGRGDHHGAELHRRQHRLPQRHDVAEHQQDALAAPHAERAQPVGDAVRPLRQFGESQRSRRRRRRSSARAVGARRRAPAPRRTSRAPS